MKNLILIVITIVFIQCDNSLDIDLVTVEALAPIYTQIEVGDLVSEDIRPFGEIGQTDYYKDYILIIEEEMGIHVIDNSDTNNPIKTAFLNLPGISDFNLSEDYLVASLANHIVTVEIIDFQNSSITSMIEQQSPNGFGSFPNMEFNGKFECVDLSKGIVSGWELKMVVNPKCQR